MAQSMLELRCTMVVGLHEGHYVR
ncbi:uncharacterized protein G2W53_022284 [Senna tora]|uniref:Uncharacterized protein n=1 Tax=Senna tora TaxID=362788 RepID=A0A834TPE4_9FABA|nr:uncharacterized protein G2W53_022284 [Senna tora]